MRQLVLFMQIVILVSMLVQFTSKDISPLVVCNC